MKNPTVPGWVTIGASSLLASLMALQHENLPTWAMVAIVGAIPFLAYLAHLQTSRNDNENTDKPS